MPEQTQLCKTCKKPIIYTMGVHLHKDESIRHKAIPDETEFTETPDWPPAPPQTNLQDTSVKNNIVDLVNHIAREFKVYVEGVEIQWINTSIENIKITTSSKVENETIQKQDK